MIGKRLITGAVITKHELGEVVGAAQAKRMCDELIVFPTPFRGVYYVPFETERKAFYITYPYQVLFEAARKFLKDHEIYYGMETALYFGRKIWNPVPAHIINRRLSKRIILRKEGGGYWRSNKRYAILKQFPYPVSFHKIGKKDSAGINYKERIAYSSFKRTKTDSEYLSKKGSQEARNFIGFYMRRH